MKTFTELYHNLCDAIDGINKNFTLHLSPIIIFMLVIDIFGSYGIVRGFYVALGDGEKHIESHAEYLLHYRRRIYLVLSNVLYSAIQIGFKAWTANIGHTTTSVAEKTKVLLAKSMNRMSSDGNVARCNLYTALMQCQTRNLKLQNQFFTIDWTIVLTVSHSVIFLLIQLFRISPSYMLADSLINNNIFGHYVRP